MKIAFFTDTYHPDLNGVTVSLDNFTEILREKGHEVIIFAPSAKSYKEKDPNVYRISSFKILSSEPQIRFPLPISTTTLKEIGGQNFDIVHAHGNGPFSLLGYQVARMKGIPYILTFHNLHTKYTHYFLRGKVVKPRMIAAGLKVFANICDGIIVPSKKMLLELESYGVKKQIEIIPNFVPYDRFQVKNTHFLHKKLKLETSVPLILSVGRLGIEKNFSFLIDVFAKVSKQQSDVQLVIVGKGPEKENLLAQCEALNIKNRVNFINSVLPSQMPKAYKDADIFVFPSQSETQGVCVLEAACASLPIVVVDDLAFDKIVDNEQNGFLLPLNTEVFSKTILKLLKDKNLREKMGHTSKEIAKNNFNGDKITEGLLSLYEKVLFEHTSSSHKIYNINKNALIRITRMVKSIDRMFD